MLNKRVITLFFCLLLGLTSLPLSTAFAQDFTPEEQKLIAFVAASFENVLNQKSLKATTESVVSQDMNISDGGQNLDILQNITQEMNVDILSDGDGGVAASYSVLDQNMSMDMGDLGSFEQPLTMEMVLDGTDFYIRYTNVPAESAALFPEGWVTLDEAGGMEMFNQEFFESLTGRRALALYEVNEETVAEIRELDGETVEDVPMRVIEIVWNADALLTVAGIDNMFNAEQLGIPLDDFLNEFKEKTISSQRVWIGESDGLPYRIDVVMRAEDLSLTVQTAQVIMTMDMNSTTTYFDFNVPVDIVIPTLGE